MWKWYLYLLIVVWVTVEVWMFNIVSPRLGVILTLVWMMLSALFGLVMMRQQGLNSLMRTFGHLSRDVVPTREMVNMGLIIVGSLLLVLPGFFSDGVGFFLLLPPMRAVVLSLLGFRNTEPPDTYPTIEIKAEHPTHGE